MVQGRPGPQRQMADWYMMYRAPPGATSTYQAPIHDSALLGRADLTFGDVLMIRRALPRADLIVDEPDGIHLVELKVRATLADVGQVHQYHRYLQRDTSLAAKLDRPVHLVLCTLNDNANVRAAAEADGIEYIWIPSAELPPLPETG